MQVNLKMMLSTMNNRIIFFRLRPKSETLLGLYYFVQFEIMNKNRIFLKEYVSMPDLIY